MDSNFFSKKITIIISAVLIIIVLITLLKNLNNDLSEKWVGCMQIHTAENEETVMAKGAYAKLLKSWERSSDYVDFWFAMEDLNGDNIPDLMGAMDGMTIGDEEVFSFQDGKIEKLDRKKYDVYTWGTLYKGINDKYWIWESTGALYEDLDNHWTVMPYSVVKREISGNRVEESIWHAEQYNDVSTGAEWWQYYMDGNCVTESEYNDSLPKYRDRIIFYENTESNRKMMGLE